MPPATRLVRPDDAPALADLLRRNRDFLAPWEPVRTDEWFTVEGQRTAIHEVLGQHERGLALPHVVLDRDGRVAGRVNLNTIVRGAFQSASVGYWVSEDRNGQGLATAGVREMKRVAFEELGLHRLEAGTLLHNAASQRVLERNAFERFGLAPRYLRIAGRWQDHVLFQVLDEDEARDPAGYFQ
ncbi:GNAT family N-acetyltransferase [Geodermatophilus ruber]|uniref:[SSU ribosomal protein S5P]-alanine acetyltransferase n=1 Tax=Geodermatophilus ruber TaxID=504800 RepID=A0A1I4KN02_9ACTN|nr:GNAT family N-acetyltransferase [Geodermatophilus ruber]SFL80152.1 [SSU ribosomal protein S5P]-alanine acetyltransferase [Geodermatophilus ruber]